MSSSGADLPSGQFGPVQHGRGRRRTGRIVIAAVLAVAVLVVGAAGALVVVSQRSMEQIELGNVGDHEHSRSPQPREGTPAAEEQVPFVELTERTNILVVGTDSRANLSDAQLLELGTEDDGSNLTDTIMLVQLDTARDAAAVLSFPRDLYVTRCDGTKGKINAAFAIGEWMGEGRGPECLVDTVEDFTGIPVDHYVQVDLAGFINAVDAIGGVTFYVQQPLRDPGAGLNIEAGCVHFDGAKALGFVRARHIDSDFGRIARQQRFLREMLAKVTSAGVLLNPVRVFSLVNRVSSSLTTDSGLGLSTQRDLAWSLRNISTDNLETRTVPGEIGSIDGASVVLADEDRAEQLFRAFERGTIIPEPAGPAAADRAGSNSASRTEASDSGSPLEPPRPQDIAGVPPVTVLNGSGAPQLATRSAELLQSRGYTIAGTGNAERFGHARTRVLHGPGARDGAEVLAASLAAMGVDARVVSGQEGDELTLVAGEDFDPDAAAASPSPDEREPATSPSAPPPAETPDFRGAQVSPRTC